MQTSIGIDVRNHVEFCCFNPCCGGRKRLFESARALSLHFARSPAWEQFANERDCKRNAPKLSLNNAEIVVQSSKRPMPLRRDVINDISHIVQHDCENEVWMDWSNFNFHNMQPNCVDKTMLPTVHCWRVITVLYCLRKRTYLTLSPLQKIIRLCLRLIKSG